MQRLLGLLLAGKESAVVVANSLALFARLLLQHPTAFEQLLGSAAAAGISATQQQQQQQQQQGGGSSPEALLLGLVSVWCEAFDSIVQPLARKLAACGLAALLGLPVKVGAMLSYSFIRNLMLGFCYSRSSSLTLVAKWCTVFEAAMARKLVACRLAALLEISVKV
jgi:hypothetical protein